jgi:hypothetical protein
MTAYRDREISALVRQALQTLPVVVVTGLGPGARALLQLTAFFTSAPILASASVVSSFRAKAVGHMAPSSRFA